MKLRILAAVIVGFSTIISAFPQVASADTFGRPPYVNYYSGVPQPDGREWMMLSAGSTPYDGITADWATVDLTVDTFIAAMKARLNDSTNWNSARAAAVMNMMMGIDGTSSLYNGPSPNRWENGITVAKNNLANWESVVRLYNAKNASGTQWVNFNDTTNPYCQGALDGFGSKHPVTGNHQADVNFAIIDAGDPSAPVCTTPKSVVFYINGSPIKKFVIKDVCGNMTGDENALVDFNMIPHIGSGAGTPDDPPSNHVSLSNPYATNGFAESAGAINLSPAQRYEMIVPSEVNITNPGGGTVTVNPDGSRTLTWYPVIVPGNGFAAGQSTAKTVGWTVKPGTPGGAAITFRFRTTPKDSSGVPTGYASITYLLNTVRTPAFVGTSGDIHAGACTGVNGNITAAGGAGSYGQYVVSATGTIAGTSSNGPAGGKTLTLGSNGGYLPVCRPDLLAAAVAGQNGTDGTLPGGSPVVNVGTLTGKNAYFYNGGGVLTLSGVVRSKLTIVAVSGSVAIASNLTLDAAAHDRNAQPSLGIISAGDITIAPATQEVNAYLFSNGTINTCSAGALSPACASVLRVNGFLMGRGIAFNRTGPTGTSGPVQAEVVNLSAQLYLNPPRFFDDLVDQLLLEGQGEQRPLF